MGVVDLNLRRSDFYEKELTFQVSCSYGPGRYDENYEQKGRDYPFGYVRWTEQRNFEAVLEAMRAGQVRVKDLITHRLPLEEAAEAYDRLLHDPAALGIIIEYPRGDENGGKGHRGIFSPSPRPSPIKGEGDKGTSQLFAIEGKGDKVTFHSSVIEGERSKADRISVEREGKSAGKCGVALIGAGNFSKMVLAPVLAKTKARLLYVCARTNGAAATHIARKYGFDHASTDLDAILADEQVNAVFIATPHNTHPTLVCNALAAGKHVFVEKPLAITEEGLQKVQETYQGVLSPSPQASPVKGEGDLPRTGQSILMVGFNRRFSPHTVKIRELLAGRTEPLSMIMTVNAGFIPSEHWTQDPEVGGGRIIGEACHFIDLLRFLVGSEIVSSDVARLESGARDTVSIHLSFGDGSIGTIHYFANGNKGFPKERLEVFCGAKILQMDNFKTLRGWGWKDFKKMKLWRQDKGHGAEVQAFVDAVSNGGPSPIPFEEMVEVTKVTLELAKN